MAQELEEFFDDADFESEEVEDVTSDDVVEADVEENMATDGETETEATTDEVVDAVTDAGLDVSAKRTSEIDASIKKIIDTYGNVESFSENVIDMIANKGMTPFEAYQTELIEKQNAKISVLEKNGTNKARNTGSQRGNQNPAGEDSFMSRFKSVY